MQVVSNLKSEMKSKSTMTANVEFKSNASAKSIKAKRLMTTNSVEDKFKKDVANNGDKENDRG